jgi:hypothetical protein
MVYNGKPTRRWLSREDAASPTTSLESIMLTAIIDAKEGRDVMTADVPNAFVQNPNASTKDGEPSDYENHRVLSGSTGRNGTRFLRSLRCLRKERKCSTLNVESALRNVDCILTLVSVI